MKEGKKFIVRSELGYSSGNATYVSSLHGVKIYDSIENKDDLQMYQQGDDEIIFLDTQKGLELILKEIEYLDQSGIPNAKTKLDDLKKGRKNLYNSNPEIISKYIKAYLNRNGLVQINDEERKNMIDKILNEQKNNS